MSPSSSPQLLLVPSSEFGFAPVSARAVSCQRAAPVPPLAAPAALRCSERRLDTARPPTPTGATVKPALNLIPDGGWWRGGSSQGRLGAQARSLTQENGRSGQCSLPELEYSTSSLTSTETARRMKDRNRFRWM